MEEKRPASAFSNAEKYPAAAQIAAAGFKAVSKPATESLIERLWQGKWVLLWTAVGFALLALMLGALRPPLYTVQTSIEVRSPGQVIRSAKSDDTDLAHATETYLQTQIRIIESRSLLERVFSRLTDAERARLSATPQFWWAKKTYEQLIESIREHISAKPSDQAGIIDIYFLCPDANAGAHFLNVMTQELADFNIERTWRAVQRNRQWTERQIDELRRKWEQSEQVLAEYTRASGAIQVTPNTPHPQPPARALQSTALVLAEANDAKLREAKIKLTGLRKQISEWQTLYGPAGANVQNFQRQAAAVELTIRQRRQALRASVNAQIPNIDPNATNQALTATKPPQRSFTSAPLATAPSMAHLNALQQEANSNRALYEASAAKLKEATIATASQLGDISVVDSAVPVSRSSTPSQWLTGLVGAVAGLIVASLYVAFRDRFSTTFASPALIVRYLGLPVLGVIPVDRFSEQDKTYNSVTQEPGLQLNFETNIRMAEAFRSIRSSILLDANSRSGLRKIVFTSPGTLEGKTFVVANLGAALASAQRRVLLVDGNLRHPSLHKIFGSSNDHGLADLLSRQISEEPITSRDVIRETQIPDLYLLSAGQAGINAPEILSSAQLPQLIREFSKGFDFILMDSPPILPYSDTRSLARSADAVVLIVKAGSTNRQSAIQARDAISQDGAVILGSIMTEWDGLNTVPA